MMTVDKKKIEKAIKDILEAIGEDPKRAGIVDTPKRVAEMYSDLLGNVNQNAAEELTVIHKETHEEMVIIKDITFHSICEHHLLPFFGKVHVIYIPKKGRITGISKINRVIENLAKRPQIQERMTTQIADIMVEKLLPQGVMVIMEAEHLCMSMRGIKKPGAKVMTSAVRGILEKNSSTRAEALALINNK
ncbi:GTP cyclohydrolase I FolE [Candidatus Margulisiibacteriota bacterium]